MGYELNRLMNQFGVSRPTMAYAGTAAPAAPAALADGATPEQQAAFNTAQMNYGAQRLPTMQTVRCLTSTRLNFKAGLKTPRCTRRLNFRPDLRLG